MNDVADKVRKRSANQAIWAVVMIVTIAAATLLILAWGHWWPSGGDWYFTAAAAIGLMLITGMFWAVATVVTIVRHRTWTWWMAAWPLTAILGLALALASTPHFDDARPQFEVVAQEVLANPEPVTLENIQIGRLEASRVYNTPTGEAYFVDARESLFGNESGWVFSPDHAPTEWQGDLTTRPIGHGWYEYQLLADY